MPLYLNELAPWERKKEYHNHIQLGRDVKEQSQIINRQTKAVIAAQLATANAVIVSQERISEGLDAVELGVNRVEQGLSELKSLFEWGISEVVWQLEQNREVLKDILEVLMAPLDTQAKERRKRAEEAFSNGWIGDAEEEYLESEKLNRYDFSIHISLGIIYLFHRIDKEKALTYFDKAIKYAKPKTNYYTSYALLYKALIFFDFGKIKEAESNSSKAVSLSPELSEALYQNAQYNAQLKNIDKCIANLKKAIKIDKLYCLKADKDTLFNPVRDQVDELFKSLRKHEGSLAQLRCKQIYTKYDAYSEFINEVQKLNVVDVSSWLKDNRNIGNMLNKTKEYIRHNSYFDYLTVNQVCVNKIINDTEKLYSQIHDEINSEQSRIYYRKSYSREDHDKKKSNVLSGTLSYIGIGSFIVPAVSSILFLEGADKLWCVVFIIPVISQLFSLGFIIDMFISMYNNQEYSKSPVAWILILYLIAGLGYLLFSWYDSKTTMDQKLTTENKLDKIITPLVDKLKKLEEIQ